MTVPDSTRLQTACIGMGSNLGDSRKLLLDAWSAIGAIQGVHAIGLSRPYITEPVGMQSSNRFVNAAALVRTVLTPQVLLEHLLRIEHGAGRLRPGRTGYFDRTLDLDLLLYQESVMNSESLVLPHPRMLDRLFVLQPLAEVAATVVHPLSGKTIEEHLLAHPAYGDERVVSVTHWSTSNQEQSNQTQGSRLWGGVTHKPS